MRKISILLVAILLDVVQVKAQSISVSGADGEVSIAITPEPVMNLTPVPIQGLFINNADGKTGMQLSATPSIPTTVSPITGVFIANPDGIVREGFTNLNRFFEQGMTLSVFPISGDVSVASGGTPHMYVRLLSSGGAPIANASVQSSWQGNTLTTRSNSDGFADVSPGQLTQPPGSVDTLWVTRIDTIVLSSAQRIPFIVSVRPQVSQMFWNNTGYLNLGYLVARLELDGGSDFGILRYQGDPDSLDVSRQFRFGVGANLGVNVGVEASITANNFTASSGAEAGGGVGGRFAELFADNYRFSFASPTQNNAAVQYLLLSTGLIKDMSGPLIPLYAAVIAAQNPDSSASILANGFRSLSMGLQLKALAQAGGDFSFEPGSAGAPLGISAGASIGANGTVGFSINQYGPSDVRSTSVDISGDMGANVSAGITLNSFNVSPQTKTLLDWQATTSGSIRIETFFNPPEEGGALEGYGLTAVRQEPDGTLNTVRYLISGSPASLADLKVSLSTYASGIIGVLFPSSDSKAGTVQSATGISAFGALLDEAGALQKENKDINVEYEVDRTTNTPISNFAVELKADLTDEISGEIGAGTGLTQSTPIVLQRGMYYEGDYLPTETYDASDYPTIQTTPQQVFQKILDQLPPDPIQQAISCFTQTVQAGQTLVVNIGQSSLQLAANALNAGTTAGAAFWTWTGNTPSTGSSTPAVNPKMKAVRMQIKKTLQQAQGLQYGIGGFYQLLPQNQALGSPAKLTIAYSPAEAAGIDQSKLAMYYWDQGSASWKLFGGTVDTVAHTVTATIDTLFLYTLAPAMPQGSFGLFVSPDTVAANGRSQITVQSNFILNNDSSQVQNGALFTVSTTLGKVSSPDADPDTAGVQVQAKSGRISFTITAPLVPGAATIEVTSLYGNASAATTCYFTNSEPLAAPTGLTVHRDSAGIFLSWRPDTSANVAGYKIYYGKHEGGPYDGRLSQDAPSPFSIGDITQRQLDGLSPDSTYYFRVTAYDPVGDESGYSNEVSISPTAVSEQSAAVPKDFVLYQNYPNPFNPSTTIKFGLPAHSQVTLAVYDILGRKVMQLVSGELSPGYHEYEWNASGFASGVYFCRMVARPRDGKGRDFVQTEKLLLLK